ncbi:GLUG motif-containing protein [Rhizobium straminoryzae]|uniref:Filamentous hemagglutinin N-terminal domain-containing protein n=1 Tax=Rhizobium straminoryzae TaxID=1387186 RepID=A0A549TFC2_9HYPH|nr:GLUG motif-containing protein [Rhizobium straminoryzae]TRL41224.1 filamentous hemagglutinin N-terminal domain-containing protein [Rhizobium straminoryzae]
MSQREHCVSIVSGSVSARRSRPSLPIALLASTALVAPYLPGRSAQAGEPLPNGGQVVSGSVAIGTSGSAMTLTQGSDKAIVNWNGFSVGQGHSVTFVQPSSSSAILNRVTGNTTSTIAGTVTGNGQVYLINPNGIAITSTGAVNVGGGFVASTLDVSNEDFLNGQYSFKGNGASAGVSNEGIITVGRGGYAALIGGTVKNDGMIAVPLGKAGLGSGEQATLDLSGDGFLQVALPTKNGAERDGALVENAGAIAAEGGTVVMKAATARNAARHAVNISGSIEADSVSGRNGEIVIGGGDGGHVAISGKVSAKSQAARSGKIAVTGKSVALNGARVTASGAKGGGTVRIAAATDTADGATVIGSHTTIDASSTGTGSGGTVLVTGNRVSAESGSLIDASGQTGGIVLLGGDYQGGHNAATTFAPEALPNADKTFMAEGAVIRADGTAGAGGKVVLWSDDTTIFAGAISATATGDAAGGTIETSGHNLLLGDNLSVSTLAQSGKAGLWLIDPYNVTVSSSGSGNVSIAVSGNPWNIAPTASGANINSSTLNAYLASSNVAITTNGGGAEAGNITVAAAVSWSAATTLSLLADASTGGVFINADISGSNAGSGLVLSAGSGGISQAGGTAIRAGTLTAAAANGGAITLTNTGNLVGALGTSSAAGSFALTNGQALTVSGSVTSNGGLSLVTTSGDLTINGALIDTHANSSLTLSAAGNLIIAKDITQSGSNASVSLSSGGSYRLTNGARVSLPDGGASLSINGTSYTLIHDVTGLQAMSGAGNYALGNDIDASATSSWNSGAGFAPVGVFGAGFSGTLTGLGHFVDGLTVNRPGTSQIGLFGYTTSATVRDLTLSNVSMNGSSRVGGLVGWADTSIFSNIHVTGAIGAFQEAGGVAGWFVDSTLSNASSAASVTVSANGAGGLAGYILYSSDISDSYATGSVTGATYVGGLIGQTFSVTPLTLTNVYASGKVTGTSAGGLIGFDDPASPSSFTLNNAYWDANSTGQASAVGSASGATITGTATDISSAPRTQSIYSGFDFTNTWVMIAGETRPMLRSEYSTVIATPTALQLMSLDLSASYELGASIDMASAQAVDGNGNYGGLWGASGFSPVGTTSSGFTGSFDGQGHTITGLTISRASTNYVGLFGYTNGATISNVTLSGGSIDGNDNVGPLIGYMSGGSVSSGSASTTVSGLSTNEVNTGGLIGTVDGGSVSGSSASGDVTGVGWDVGGLVGYLINGGTITQSYATGNVTGTGTSATVGYVGGLVGSNGYISNDGGTISQSYATGTVTGTMGPVGGLVGHNEGTITDAYASGRVIGLSGASNIGGFVGVNYVHGTITNAYSTGYVTGSSLVGGFAGYNNNISSAITSAYWNSETSGQSSGIFGGSGGITARTTAQLQGSLPPGFSSSIWSTGTSLYPYFGWRYPTTPVAISGVAYSDAGLTQLPGQIVTAVSGGNSIGSAVTGNNGYYYILTPASSLAATGVITYLDNGSTQGAAFSDVPGSNGVQNVAIYGTAAHVITGQSTLSATRTNYLAARGSYSDADLSFLSSSSFAPLTTSAGYGVYLNTTGSYTLNANIGSSGLLNIDSGGTLGVNGAVTLSAAGALTIADALSWTTASSLALSTTSGGNISLGGAVTGSNGTLIVNASGTATTSSAVDVGTFNLSGGTWSQTAATLPSFAATHFTLGSGTTFLRATSGDGSAATPYQIADLYGLQGIGSSSLLSQNFALAGDIDASGSANWNSGMGFNPIGTNLSNFLGNFDGANHTISGLFADNSGRAGLFGVIGAGATVSNLTVDASVNGVVAGVLAASNLGTINNVKTSGTVLNTGNPNAGSGYLGGLVGNNQGNGEIINSSSSATVTNSQANVSAGGLAGASQNASASISNSFATGTVTSSTATNTTTAGLVAVNSGTITGSYATGNASGGLYSGGLVAVNSGDISNTFATGAVNGTTYAGGLVGRNNADISESYGTGNVSAGSYAGGFVGYNDGAVSNSYSTGSASGATYGGGFIGYLNSGPVTASFWNTSTSGSALGIGAGSSTGVVGLATPQMTALSTFTGAGWNIDDDGGTSSIWRIYDGYTAPLLRSFMTGLTVTGGNGSKTYDGTTTSSSLGTVTYSPSGYTAGLVSGTAIYTASSDDAGTYSGSNLKLSGLYSGQLGYDIDFVAGSLTIDRRAITVAADAGVMVYGDAVPGLTYRVTSGSLVIGDSLSGTLSTTATSLSDVGTYGIAQGSLSNANYDITYVGADVTINPATLTITAQNGRMPYGGPVPSLSYGVTGWKNSDNATMLSGVTVSTDATATSPAGGGYLTFAAGGILSGTAVGNYLLNYVDGTFQVDGRVTPTGFATAGHLPDPPIVAPASINTLQGVLYTWESAGTASLEENVLMSVEHRQLRGFVCALQDQQGGTCGLN